MEKLDKILQDRRADKGVPQEVPTGSSRLYTCYDCKDTGWNYDTVPTHYTGYGGCNACRSCAAGEKALEEWKSHPEQQKYYRAYKMEKIERMLRRSGVGPRFREKRLADLSDVPKLQELCTKYAENWRDYSPKGWGLYLWGNVGAGKTHTVTAIANELIEQELVQVFFVNLGDVADRVKKTFGAERKNLDAELFDDMKTAELLVLDDIGVENVTDWLAEHIYLIINHRYEHNLPMLVTSNQSLEDLSKTHRPQICSRLQEMCRVIHFTGEDRRQSLRPDF